MMGEVMIKRTEETGLQIRKVKNTNGQCPCLDVFSMVCE
jgi:hypothetical protein